MRIFALLLLCGTVLGQDCVVVSWEKQPYSQSAFVTRNQVVYTVDTPTGRVKIARETDRVEMQPGPVTCRIENDRIYMQVDKREKKFRIIGAQ